MPVLAELRKYWWYLSDSSYRSASRGFAEMIRKRRIVQANAMREIRSKSPKPVVMSGPFAGMHYLDQFQGGVFPQKLLGTYEKELWPVWEEASAQRYSRVVDVGAAEGYYVAGLARLLPSCQVVAFEANPKLHRCIRELATINGVADRISLHGTCDEKSLATILSDKEETLLICDIEGYEWEVLDPEAVPMLSNVDILVEVHEHLRPGVSEKLRSRFDKTHRISVVNEEPRSVSDLPDCLSGSSDAVVQSMDEYRGTKGLWYWMSRNRSVPE